MGFEKQILYRFCSNLQCPKSVTAICLQPLCKNNKGMSPHAGLVQRESGRRRSVCIYWSMSVKGGHDAPRPVRHSLHENVCWTESARWWVIEGALCRDRTTVCSTDVLWECAGSRWLYPGTGCIVIVFRATRSMQRDVDVRCLQTARFVDRAPHFDADADPQRVEWGAMCHFQRHLLRSDKVSDAFGVGKFSENRRADWRDEEAPFRWWCDSGLWAHFSEFEYRLFSVRTLSAKRFVSVQRSLCGVDPAHWMLLDILGIDIDTDDLWECSTYRAAMHSTEWWLNPTTKWLQGTLLAVIRNHWRYLRSLAKWWPPMNRMKWMESGIVSVSDDVIRCPFSAMNRMKWMMPPFTESGAFITRWWLEKDCNFFVDVLLSMYF